MTTLYIAEKPSLGKAIAAGLPAPQKRGDGYIECGGGNLVTWAFGHIYEQAEPDEYTPDDVPRNPKTNRKRWRLEDLPILPTEWKKKPKGEAAKQIKVIRGLLKQASSVVNAGDPDREGQLLVDEILEACRWDGPTKRIWLAALDETSVARALATLKDNSEYTGLRDAAEARARADWLVGMNLTRAFTLQNSGSGVVSVGRVQTPTLALVAKRDTEIEYFKPHDFYAPTIAAGGVKAAWRPATTDGPEFDSEGRLTNKTKADALVAAAKQAGQATVVTYKKEAKRQGPPLGLSLAELQKQCSAKFGLGAQAVLDIAQALYEEHQATSYPRTDCRYLPEEQHSDAKTILSKLTGRFAFAGNADPSQKSATWNTKKVTAHHGIVPTGKVPARLTDAQAKVYALICRAYIAQFYQDYEYDAIAIALSCAGETWAATGRKTRVLGWREVFGDAPSDAELPALTDGQSLPIEGATVETKQTTPPKRFTEGSLIEAMSNIHRFIEDADARSKLKETSGLGTEATRAAMLEKLKERGFIVAKGKTLVSTPAGRAAVSALPAMLTDPVTTARWEDMLSAIADGKLSLEQFEQAQRKAVTQLVEQAKTTRIRVGEARPTRKPGGKSGPACPDCKKPTITLSTKKGKPFYKCEDCQACWWPDRQNAKALGSKWDFKS